MSYTADVGSTAGNAVSSTTTQYESGAASGIRPWGLTQPASAQNAGSLA